MQKPKPKPIIKKVTPYPFPAQLTGGSPQPIPVAILQLRVNGFLADAKNAVFVVGKELTVAFTLPASTTHLTAGVKVMKTHDRFVPLEPAKTPEPGAAGAPAV